MKKHPVMKDVKSDSMKWKWVIGLSMMLTLAVAALLFVFPKPEPPLQAPAQVRSKIVIIPETVESKQPEINASEETDDHAEVEDEADEVSDEDNEADVQEQSEAEEDPLLAEKSTGSAAAAPNSEATPPVVAEAALKPQPPSIPADATTTAETVQKPAETAKATQAVGEGALAPSGIKVLAAAAPEKNLSPADPSRYAPFTIQVGAFRNKTNADQMIKRLNKGGYEPFIFTLEIEGKEPLYLVRFGGFATRGAADAALADFNHKENMTAVVARAGSV